MEEQQLVIWGPGGPAMVYSSVMERFGLKQGQRIENAALFEQVIDENINQSRAACSIEAQRNGEECEACGS